MLTIILIIMIVTSIIIGVSYIWVCDRLEKKIDKIEYELKIEKLKNEVVRLQIIDESTINKISEMISVSGITYRPPYWYE
jgi:hypothetical protein